MYQIDNHASRVSTGLYGFFIKMNYKSIISNLEYIKISSEKKLSLQHTFIKAENKAAKNLQSRLCSTELFFKHIFMKTKYKAQSNLQSCPHSTAFFIKYGSLLTEDKSQNVTQSRSYIQIKNKKMAKKAAELLTTC